MYIDLDRAKYEMELQRSLQTIVKELGKENTYRIHGTRIVAIRDGNTLVNGLKTCGKTVDTHREMITLGDVMAKAGPILMTVVNGEK